MTQLTLMAIPSSRLLTRRYGGLLTADVNEKGVLDVDTVKGCTSGMAARPAAGCYDACYAAAIAKFRGIEFGVSVARVVRDRAQARSIERAVARAPEGFFRVGTMGDPSHAWAHTVDIVEWLAPLAVPVIVTKHWRKLTDDEIARLVRCGAVLNTSVSALDTPAELAHREAQIRRYKQAGGVSVARVVSCAFNTATEEGRRMDGVQRRLFGDLAPTLDNPLRVSRTHPLVVSGVVLTRVVGDLQKPRVMSLQNTDTYTGPCGACPDKCGLTARGEEHPVPPRAQLSFTV